MSMVINTNMGAINANRILDSTTRDQSTAMERLTSGLRINKSADDAAGLAVVTGMTTQIRGTEMAVRNANDGMALIQTMDGAAEEVVNMVQRIRELAVLAMNDTYSDDNRTQMNTEVTELKNEITRVANTTKFNETALMNDDTTLSMHVGWEQGANNKVHVSTVNFTQFKLVTGAAVDSAANASKAVSMATAMLTSLQNTRAKWGALQNRLEYTVSNLLNVNENIQAARSQVWDANFAEESAKLARTQVLQQAGMAMLGQANQNSQNVMSLLR